jgi:hypothetical protein
MDDASVYCDVRIQKDKKLLRDKMCNYFTMTKNCKPQSIN